MVRVNSNEGAPSLTPVSKSVSKVSLWTFVVSQYRRLKASKGLASAGLMFFTLTISVKSHHKKIVRTHFEAVRRKRIILLPRLQVGENRNRNGSKNKERHEAAVINYFIYNRYAKVFTVEIRTTDGIVHIAHQEVRSVTDNITVRLIQRALENTVLKIKQIERSAIN